jgi:hypothetical protein
VLGSNLKIELGVERECTVEEWIKHGSPVFEPVL